MQFNKPYKLVIATIDCAAAYCNEKEIGKVFEELFSSGQVKRKDILSRQNYGIHVTRRNMYWKLASKTLKDLRLDYLDLYLMHWPIAFEYTGLPITGENALPRDAKGKPQLCSSFSKRDLAGNGKCLFATVLSKILVFPTFILWSYWTCSPIVRYYPQSIRLSCTFIINRKT
eukprot:jgi/Galph1/2416/GphlegSOOS_G1070.1